MDARRKEWYDLEEKERNSLVWPDILQWHIKPRKVSILRPDSDDSIGLVTTSVQDQMTGEWYNIIKHTKENHPVHNHVNRFEWVFEVDGTTTTNCPSKKFSSLFKNGKNEILLSLKETVDPLSKFQKDWGAEKTVTLKDKNKNKFRLHHFYSKKDNGEKKEIKDHILISEVNVDLETSTGEPLHRGDELLAVNGQPLKKAGEKLAEIWGRIARDSPAEVELTIKKIQPKICNDKVVVNLRDVAPEIEGHLNSPDASMIQKDEAPKCDNPTQLIVVEQEMNKEAGRNENEAYVKDPSDCESCQASRPDTTEEHQDIEDVKKPTQETSKTRKRLSSLSKRLSLKGSSGGNKVENEELTSKDLGKVSALKNENEGYANTPPPVRKLSPPVQRLSAPSDKMCGKCVMKSETQLSDNRDEWPIDKIEHGCFDEMCKVIDLPRSNTSIISVLNFTRTDAESIIQQFAPQGGQGVAKKALGIWGASNSSHNVGALKEIFQYTIPRTDVLEKITKWEKMSVCHGCGIKHPPEPQQ